QAVQRQLVEMRQYEFSPLAQIQGWSDAPRGKELFDCLFVFANYPEARSERSPSVQFNVKDVRFIEKSNYPLTVELVLGEELKTTITYDRSRYDQEAIERMANHYQQALRSIVENVDQTVAEIEILTEEEKRQLVIEWNETAADYR